MSDEAIHKAVDAARTFLQNDAERLPTSIANSPSSTITRIIAMPLKKAKLRGVKRERPKVVKKAKLKDAPKAAKKVKRDLVC